MVERVVLILLNRPAEDLLAQVFAPGLAEGIGVIAAHGFHMSPEQRMRGPFPFSAAVVLECRGGAPAEDPGSIVLDAFGTLLGDDGMVGVFDALLDHRGAGRLETCERINLALTRPLEGSEAAFEHWYETQHFPDGLRLPGYVGGQRFKQRAGEGKQRIPLPFLALYELQGVALDHTIATLAAWSGTSAMPVSPAFDASFYWAWYLERVLSRQPE